ncbi:NUDIX hydrolase [Nocardioides sp. BP30]|uniref:NUDIX hydrolase n=1 Tax=Nocardioides sp. BP30 TaxID=3036374 RepID=UPI002468572C|nr:NUDIX hydrolase [Nocardioides sp. BP30]WGL53656.1 NUDIX hydrolase [Nocardioides sp. BP30]
MTWETLSSRRVYENPWITVREDDVRRPDGTPGIYGVVEVRHPAVFVVPVTDAGEVVLVRQHRYTIGRESLEIPAGGTDGEDVLAAARRELVEETGYDAGDLRLLAEVYSLNGVSRAPGHVVLATGLTRVGAGGGLGDEGITAVEHLAWPTLFELLGAGEIHDGETAAALMYAAVALGRVR